MNVHIKINGKNVVVEVSVEIGEYLDRANHKTENLFHEQRCHWDGREFDEYIVAHECSRSYYETPEDWLLPERNPPGNHDGIGKLHGKTALSFSDLRIGRPQLFPDW